jgi:hypothetical protein
VPRFFVKHKIPSKIQLVDCTYFDLFIGKIRRYITNIIVCTNDNNNNI